MAGTEASSWGAPFTDVISSRATRRVVPKVCWSNVALTVATANGHEEMVALSTVRLLPTNPGSSRLNQRFRQWDNECEHERPITYI